MKEARQKSSIESNETPTDRLIRTKMRPRPIRRLKRIGLRRDFRQMIENRSKDKLEIESQD